MARTTLDLDPAVTEMLRERAKREGKSMGQVASEALAAAFADEPAVSPPFVWHSYHMGVPLIDLEDKDALYRILDEEGMSVSIDANILIYAANIEDPLHEPAQALVERLSAGPDLLYLFWPTILAYLRITTNPRALQAPLPTDRAIENIDGLLRLPFVVSPSEGKPFWATYLASGGRLARGNMVPDTHLATLMRENGVRILYTRDRGFRRFDFLDVRDPFSHRVNEASS